MNSSEIRQLFLDFFRVKEHHIIPSAPMVIKNDPTLMFTNAGMNQFKDIFLGHQPAKYTRIADTQKCLRVSGKHNDLEEVGLDTYHHTMFEMLGNWSFGDYFKKEAIAWAWEFLTESCKIEKDRLYVTVFSGDEKDGLPKDQEAFNHWKKIVPEDRILLGSKKDNFWEMGDTGPCGPCSEIHADIRSDEERKVTPGHALVNAGHPQVIEIWNLVFIEFNRLASGKLEPLPARHVDTGMGFERLCMVLHGKQSNYDTDVFQPLIHAIAKRSGIPYGSKSASDIAMRVIADHLRAVSFAIADGQLPSNNKAGYVIRRILRRAIRYGYTALNIREPFIHELVPALADQMGNVFPELIAQRQLITKAISEEESAFLKTLSQGIQRFNTYLGETGKNQVIDGAFAFELYDTYGFPVDLTQLMAREQGWSVDMDGFQQGLEAQKNRSKQAATVETSDWTVLREDVSDTVFIGYDQLSADVNVVKYRKIKTKNKDQYQIVLDQTPFYAESGGQVGDRGVLQFGTEQIEVTDTQKENNLIVHLASRMPSDPTLPCTARVDAQKRLLTANNHSATHLLHAALKKVLGSHVEQRGSLVDENHLRFDFTHFSKMTPEEIRQVEVLVNEKVRQNISLHVDQDVPLEQAKSRGAAAIFGEKYGDTVRVVTFNEAFSIELCGGTHVPATGQIGLFRIISESAIAAGIRRIEAITADAADNYFYHQSETIEQIKEAVKNPKDVLKGVQNILDENNLLREKYESLLKDKISRIKEQLLQSIEEIEGINYISSITDLDVEGMKQLAYSFKNEPGEFYLFLASQQGDKVNLLLFITDSLCKRKNLDASKIIRELAKEIKGGGGGQPFLATAGGTYIQGMDRAIHDARKYL
ncbi:MAG: alanine--tRNA ligase [Bacteroidetes bacterium]|nr:alanine--tRNA ligase [Bacteroidota bacterium]